MSERFAWFFDKKIKKKVWVADMWARKAVLAIQTAITGITSRLTTIETAGYQTSADVSSAIASAIGGITELEYTVVSTLPAAGAKGVIYLVPHQHGTGDIYDEYIWVNNSFEKIGNTDVDLSQYLLKTDISSWAKATTKPSYTASEVGALPDTTSIPAKTSDLTNDSGFITGYTETDPTVPSWAKASTKPTYTAAEVGALPDTTVIPSVPSNISAFTNDAGYITGYTETDPTVPSWAKASTKPTYTAGEVGALPDSTVIPDASSAIPSMDGTGATGSSTDYARADHVHPADTSKQDALSTAQLAAVNSGITADDLAVNNASVLCKATPIVPTLTDGSHYSAVGGCWYYKVGCRVHVHIGVTGLTSGTTADLWYMPEGYRPYSHVGVVGTGSSMTNYARLRISPQGRVFVNANAVSANVDVEYDAFQ